MTAPPKKILVIDDDESTRELIELALEAQDVQVLTADNGATGLEMTLAHGPDLIFLDVMLPKMSGWEVCRIIKQNPRSQDIPIVMLTSLGGIRNKVMAIQLGADDYMTKPFELRELVEKVQRALSGSNADKIVGDATNERAG